MKVKPGQENNQRDLIGSGIKNQTMIPHSSKSSGQQSRNKHTFESQHTLEEDEYVSTVKNSAKESDHDRDLGGIEDGSLSSVAEDDDRLNLKVTKDIDYDSVEDLVAMGLAAQSDKKGDRSVPYEARVRPGRHPWLDQPCDRPPKYQRSRYANDYQQS